jgi:hypothetical protein
VTGQEYAVDTVSKDGEIKVIGNRGESASMLLLYISSSEGRPCCTVMCETLRYTLAGTYSRCSATAMGVVIGGDAVTISTIVLTTPSYHSLGGRSVAVPQEGCQWGSLRVRVLRAGALCVRGRTNGDQ